MRLDVRFEASSAALDDGLLRGCLGFVCVVSRL